MSVDVQYQPTPNPNSMKFVVNRTVVESGSESYMDAEAAKNSPLASAAFRVGRGSQRIYAGQFHYGEQNT